MMKSKLPRVPATFPPLLPAVDGNDCCNEKCACVAEREREHPGASLCSCAVGHCFVWEGNTVKMSVVRPVFPSNWNSKTNPAGKAGFGVWRKEKQNNNSGKSKYRSLASREQLINEKCVPGREGVLRCDWCEEKYDSLFGKHRNRN